MNNRLPNHVLEQFSPEDTVNVNAYVDDCRCACRSAFTVKDGLLNVHGRPIFDRLLIDGDLIISGDPDIQRLPDLLAATGSIIVSDCPNLKIMPSKMYSGEAIRLDRTNVRDLPHTFWAEHDIYMNECPNVLAIPEGIRTRSLFATACAKLKGIPSGLEFATLDLSGTPVVELPSQLTIKSDLVLRDCASLARVHEGITVAAAVDVRGCDRLFTLPRSVQPTIAITDGMMAGHNLVIVPEMTAEEASMCLGFKAIEAFPHRHFKNLDGMQDPVIAVDRDGRGRRGYAVGVLESDRPRRVPDDFLRRLIGRLDQPNTMLLSGPLQIKRLR